MAARPTMAELERQCQKPDYRRIGNWMARKVTRPLALRITWLLLPLGISANQCTCAAWLCATAAALAFALGSVFSWLIGAFLLQTWYVLDHVDGQLARWRGTASLDGVQLDYLMHHAVNLLVPLGAGWGGWQSSENQAWLVLGVAWGVALLLLSLIDDTRYKAFIQRLKRLDGELRVLGRAGTSRALSPPAGPALRMARLARKSCEMHVIMNVLGLAALCQWAIRDDQLWIARGLVAAGASAATAVSLASIARSQRRHAAEAEFASWYQTRPSQMLRFDSGVWRVVDATVDQARSRRLLSPTGSREANGSPNSLPIDHPQ